jgi:prepilin signal peptidase PulO-like enzyme (type II secretory pathway)
LLISGIIGAGFFLFQFVISRGKWIGGGDIRLGLLMGFALGWPGILAGIFLAYIIGSLVGLYLLATKKKTLSAKVPLGVFLSPATLLILFWGEVLIDWYLGLLLF